MNSNYRKEIGRRTRRGLEGKARAGKSAGGKSYGYISAKDAGREQRVIDPAQAAGIKRIFEMYASGSSAKTIAATLNREKVASPGSPKPAPRAGSTTRSQGVASLLRGTINIPTTKWQKLHCEHH